MKTRLYGIPNCDTMKKARAWLDSHGVEHEFHDYKKSGIERAKLDAWVQSVGWEVLLNRAGTTFRKLPDSAKANLTEARAVKLMLEQPSMIKRPVLERGKTLLVGFSPEKYAALK
jgi:arsenate reductase (glutaredoxin)